MANNFLGLGDGRKAGSLNGTARKKFKGEPRKGGADMDNPKAVYRQDVRYYVDFLPWCLALCDDPSEVEYYLAEATEEPAAILTGYRGKVGLNHLDGKLVEAARELLEALSALRDRLAEWDFPRKLQWHGHIGMRG